MHYKFSNDTDPPTDFLLVLPPEPSDRHDFVLLLPHLARYYHHVGILLVQLIDYCTVVDYFLK